MPSIDLELGRHLTRRWFLPDCRVGLPAEKGGWLQVFLVSAGHAFGVALRHGNFRFRVFGRKMAPVCQVFNSNTASTSTGILAGSDPMPTALRTPLPFVSPQISTIRLLNPLIT